MLKRTSRLLALALLCGVGQAGVSMRADEPVKTGQQRDTLLYVRTDPPGAKVLVNGTEVGTSNGLFHVEPGSGKILIELEGRAPVKRDLVIRANGITRLVLKLKPQAGAAQGAPTGQPGPSGQRERSPIGVIAHLPQDSTVELVGVTEGYRPTLQSRWWTPDGSAAAIGPFSALQRYPFPRLIADDKVFTFLVRFANLPADASTDPAGGIKTSTTPQGPVELRGSRNWVPGFGTTAGSPAQFPIGAPLWEETAVYDALDAHGVSTLNSVPPSRPAAADGAETSAYHNIVPPYYKMFPMVLAGSAPTTDLRVGVSMGAWETVTSWKPDRAGASSFQRDGREWKVTFSKARTSHSATAGNTTRVTLTSASTYGQWMKRLVAVASDGSEHAASIGDSLGGDNGPADFPDLPLSSIKELRLQVRPYHWVEFDNISLQFGKKTDVKVVSPDGPPARPITPESPVQEGEKTSPRKPSPARKVDFAIGPNFFSKGDKIVIQEVRSRLGSLADGDTVTVKGTCTLQSHPAAELWFYITTNQNKGTPVGRAVHAGTESFELERPIDCDGYLHLGLYEDQEQKCIGTIYFGTDSQMKVIRHWRVGN